MANNKKQTELHRMVVVLKGIVNKAEKCTSALRDAFLNGADFKETTKTIARMDAELMKLNLDIENNN